MKNYTVLEMYKAMLDNVKPSLDEFEAWVCQAIQEEGCSSYEQGYLDGQDSA